MDIIFEDPKYLYFLLFVPLIVITHFLVLRFTRKQAIPFGNFETLSRISRKYIFSQNNVQLIIRILGVIVVCFSLASPVAYIDVPDVSENTVFLIDASDSMFVTNNGSSPWIVASDIIREYVEYHNFFTSVGVVSYSTISKVVVPPTKDSVIVKNKLEGLVGHGIGGTDIGTALVNAIFLASTQKGSSKIVVLSDGMSLFGSSMSDALQLASDNKIRIDFITTNLKTDNLVIEDSLKKIAEVTGGQYVQLRSTNVGNVVEDLLYSPSSVIYVDLRELLLIIALILLTVEWALSKSIFKTVPHE